MKLKYTLLLYLFMALAVPFPDYFAAGHGTPPINHWIYMFGHAGWLHYLLNGLGWLMMWKIATPARTLTAYLLGVVAVYVLPLPEAVLGWSAILYYYLGLCLAYMPPGRRSRVLALTCIGFLIPHIAASIHLFMLAAGWIIRKIELRWERSQ